MWTSGSRVSNLLYIYNKYNIYTYFSALLNPTAACCSNTSQYQETPPAESIFFWQTAASRLLGFWTFRYRNGYGSTFNSTERTMCLITHLSVWFILASYSFFGRYPNSNYIFKCGLVGKCFQHLMVKTVLFFVCGGGRQFRQMSADVGMSFARIEWKKVRTTGFAGW